jgi:plastocyanin
MSLMAFAPAYAGDVAGTVKFEGKAPEMKPITLSADAGCAAMHKDKPLLNEILVLGEGQTMANVLITVTKGLPDKKYPAPAEPFILTQEGCHYAPHVFAIQAGQTVKVANPDGLLHNVHNEPALNTAVNRAMPANLTEIEMTFEKVEAKPFIFKCDIHPWMQAWCAVLDNPFFAVTKEDGKFSIKGLEPGEYEISAWHEKLGTKTATVTVAADGAAQADFTFAK